MGAGQRSATECATDQGCDAGSADQQTRGSNSVVPPRALRDWVASISRAAITPLHFASVWTERGKPMSSVRCSGSPPWVYAYDLHMKAAKRKSLRKSDFVYPPGSRIGGSQGRYPIDTKKRARAALRYSARADTAGTYKTVSNKVYKRYPSLSTS